MNEFYGNLDMTNYLENEMIRNTEISEGQDYSGEKSFSEAFEEALQEFIYSVKELFGLGAGSEAKEVNETLTEKASDVMAEVFDRKTISEWGTMSMEQREAKLSEYYSKMGRHWALTLKGLLSRTAARRSVPEYWVITAETDICISIIRICRIRPNLWMC